MATYLFELIGCDASNSTAAQSALAAIPGVTISLFRSANGSYLLSVESNDPNIDVPQLVGVALANLGIRAIMATAVPPVVIGVKSKFKR